MRVSLGLAAAAVAISLATGVARAADVTVWFLLEADTKPADPWFGSTPPPFGMKDQPRITGDFVYDTSTDEFTGLTLQTGTKTWSASDINQSLSSFSIYKGTLPVFTIVLPPASKSNFFTNFDTAEFSDATDWIACNGCVQGSLSGPYPATPEPATWAMMLIGLAGLGALMRSRGRATD